MIRLILVFVALSLIASTLFAAPINHERARCAIGIAYHLTAYSPDDTTDDCPSCGGTGKVGDGVSVFDCEDCDGSGKIEPPAKPIKLPTVSVDVDSWDAGEVAEAFVTHMAQQEPDFEMPVGGLFDKKIEAPAFVPALLRDLNAGKEIKIPSAGASVSWQGNDRNVSFNGGGVLFSPPLTVGITKWGLSIHTSLNGADISPDGTSVTLLLRRSPDLTLNITPKTADSESSDVVIDGTVIPPPPAKPVKSERDFALFVVANYGGVDYVESGTNDARASHLIRTHNWDAEAVNGLSRHQRRRLHGASHTGQVANLRSRWEQGGTTVSPPIVRSSSSCGRWVTQKTCRNGRCFTTRVRVSN